MFCAIAFMAMIVPSTSTAQQVGVANPSSPIFQIRAMQEEFAEGMQRIEFAGTVLSMANEDVVNDSHIESMTVTRTETGLLLRVRFTPEGVERFSRMTQIQVGKRMGLLIGSRLVSAPTVAEPITLTTRGLDVGLILPESEVDSVVAVLEARFDPVPNGNGRRIY